MALGEKMGLLQKSGNSYKYGDLVLGRGYDATRQFLKDNKKVAEELLGKIRKFMKEEGFNTTPSPVDTEEEKPEE